MNGLSQEKQDMIRALASAMGTTPEQLIDETMKNKMKRDLTNDLTYMDANGGGGLMRYAMKHNPNPEVREIVTKVEKEEEKPKRTTRKPKAEKNEEAPKKRIPKAKQETVKYAGTFKCSKCKQDKDASEFEVKGNRMLKTCSSCKDIAMIKKIKGCGAHIKI